MEWYHKANEKWLAARRDVITATELIDLRPKMKRMAERYRTGKDVHPNFAAVWGRKHSSTPDDPTSFGAAARGHIMEPYAVEEFNRRTGLELHHWDDVIITNDDLGYSPDAFDVPCPHCNAGSMEFKGMHNKPEVLGEIKSYGIEHHYMCMVADKMKLPERYQIAAGMLCCPSVKTGYLILYCPQAKHGIVWRSYSRAELDDEIAELSQTLGMYSSIKHRLEAIEEIKTTKTEQEIWEENTNDPLAL